jgi:hypothetical protein
LSVPGWASQVNKSLLRTEIGHTTVSSKVNMGPDSHFGKYFLEKFDKIG